MSLSKNQNQSQPQTVSLGATSPRRTTNEKREVIDALKLKVKEIFIATPQMTPTQMAEKLSLDQKQIYDLYAALKELETEGAIKRMDFGGAYISLGIVNKDYNPNAPRDPRVPVNVKYLDWNGNLATLMHCRKHKIPALCIGKKGTGKTQAIEKVCELTQTPLYTVNFSLRVREHNFLGRLDTKPDGTVYFKKGPLPQSMEAGGCFYADETNTGEPDVLVRFDEALDDRRQVTVECETIKAAETWWPVSSINPLDHAGTKEMPPQLTSRFPVRIYFDYPDEQNELQIVKTQFPAAKQETLASMKDIIRGIQKLRKLDLPYTPSLRETIAIAELIESGMKKQAATKLTLVNVYWQWGETQVTKVQELLNSLGLIEIDSANSNKRIY
jgi:nitric oxide reductase NorQ protein